MGRKPSFRLRVRTTWAVSVLFGRRNSNIQRRSPSGKMIHYVETKYFESFSLRKSNLPQFRLQRVLILIKLVLDVKKKCDHSSSYSI